MKLKEKLNNRTGTDITKQFRLKLNPIVLTVILVILPILAMFISLCIGRYSISPIKIFHILISTFLPFKKCWTEIERSVVLNIRLPRILMAMMVGAGLSVSGASFQGLFRNPLVSPGILGVAAGAGFGACLGILLSGSIFIIQIFAFFCGLLALLSAYFLSRTKNGSSILMLVLAGVIIGALCQALIGIAKTVADPENQLPAIVYWLLGSMAGTTYKNLFFGIPPIFAGNIVLFLLRWRINILSLGEEEAQSLGVNTKWIKWVVIIAATCITAASVSLCGMIGWIGLVVPHIARMLVGPNHKVLIPVCLSIGAFSLVTIDNIARSASAAEIPLSIVAALIGAPFFAYLLRRTGGRWT